MQEQVRVTRPDGRVRKLEDIESEIIEVAVRLCDYNMSRAARDLGIGRSTLYRKMPKL